MGYLCDYFYSFILYLAPFVLHRTTSWFIWDYANYLFYVSCILFSVSCFIVVKNAIQTKTTLKHSLDIVILLIPLTTFMVTEFYLKNEFINKRRLEQIDALSLEIKKSSEDIANVLGVEFNVITGPESIDSLHFGSLIYAVNKTFQEVVEISGGFKFEDKYDFPIKLLNPHNTNYPNIALNRSNVLENLNVEFEKAKLKEEDSLVKDKLTRIQTDLFGEEVVFNNSVLEMRIRCYTAENRLLTLELIKKNRKRKILTN